MHNTTSYHQGPINIATFFSTFIQNFKGADHKMTFSAGRYEDKKVSDALSLIFIGALIMIPFSFLPSNPVAWVVKEKECGARHLQHISGLNYLIYWFCNFVFDYCAYFITMILCIIIFAIFNRQEFIAPDRFGALFVLLLVYGVCSTLMAYAASFLFKEHSNAQNTVMGFSFAAGFLLIMIVYILQQDEDTMDTADLLRKIFRIVPSYCIGEGLFALLLLDGKIKVGSAAGPWDMDQLGWPCVYMSAEIPLFAAIVLLVDNPFIKRFWERRKYDRKLSPIIDSDEDSDVEEERLSVYEADKLDDDSDVVRVIDLQKKYNTGKVAVKGITFSIFPGEVFGFLGTNGAGKTTTISIMCQSFLPTGGSASICGYDIVQDSKEALACVGYCPQFDATLDLLSVEEHIELYSRIRGVCKADRPAVIDGLLSLAGLTKYRKTLASKLSGGNRRKLSVALTLVGGPQVIFLDEPSAGMDPVARRGLWTSIQRAAVNCSVVLTTHHLEEVEALADMVAIMVSGSLKCIGDKVHLKNKFGQGYEVSARVVDPDRIRRVQKYFENEYPGCAIKEVADRRIVYEIPNDFGFADIFEGIQTKKKSLGITDYSVAQTSIEQIFISVSGGLV
ncbi:ABC transporter-like protein [Angomonas deanei]|nr:ABC transporter-like protein [Angomonas deanei]|eukprot:EPY38279.1 ABC transporter-like protein [Angomonas deanei]